MTAHRDRTRSSAVAHELAVAEDAQELAGREIRRALRACPDLTQRSAERDALWMTIQSAICTTSPTLVAPFGSTAPVLVTEEHATDELITAMDWLLAHENEARRLTPLQLFVTLRGVATRSRTGSARSARADALHGMTGVPAGCPIRWTTLDNCGAA